MRLERLQRHAATPWAIRADALHAIVAQAPLMPGMIDIERDEDEYELRDGVAIIDASGIVDKDTGPIDRAFGALDVDELRRLVARAVADESVRAIVIDFDSPGGVVTGVPEAAAHIAEMGKSKPIVAFTDTLACSAAYWLASGAGAIIATPSAEVGSIGVYLPVLDVSALYERAGVKVDLVKAGALKAIGFPGTSMDDEGRAYLQAGVDEVHSMFKAAVTRNRTVADGAMEGQSFMGAAAMAAGLVDGLGELDDAVELARQLGSRSIKSAL